MGANREAWVQTGNLSDSRVEKTEDHTNLKLCCSKYRNYRFTVKNAWLQNRRVRGSKAEKQKHVARSLQDE
jgi:hypothetical protein